MRPFARVASAAVPLASVCAIAQVPSNVAYQGRLVRSDGTPEAGIVDMSFYVYGAPTGGAAIACDAMKVALSDGFYSVLLGGVGGCLAGPPPIAPGIFDGDDLYVELVIANTPLAPRQRIVTVPYAHRAGTAANVRGGTVEATSVVVGGTSGVSISAAGIAVGGTTVVDAAGKVSLVTGAGLTGTGTSASPLAVAADGVTSSMLARDAASLGRVSDGALTATGGNVGVGAATPQTRLEVAGGLKVGTEATCDAARAGTIRFAGARFEGCTGTAWVRLDNLPDGLSQATAAFSCQDVLSQFSSPDGVYWLDPDGGSTSNAFRGYCDMTEHGGGWTLMGKLGESVLPSGISVFDFDLNTSVLLDALPPASSSMAHFDLKKFDGYGLDWTIRMAVDSFTNRSHFQYQFIRPKAGASCTPGRAGANWWGVDTYTRLEYLYESSTTGLSNTTWLSFRAWSHPAVPTKLLFEQAHSELSGSCLTTSGQTQECHCPPGAVVDILSSGTHTACFGLNDGVAHAHGKRSTYWIKAQRVSGSP